MTEETIVVPQTFFDRPIKDILQSEEFLQWGRQQFFRLHQKYIDILPKGSEKNGVVLRVGLKRKKSKSDDVEVQWMAFVKNFESSRKEWYYFGRSKSLPPFCTHSFRDILTSVADTTAKHPTRSFYNNVTSVLGRFVPDMAETRPYYVDRDMMANYVVVPSREGDTYRYNNDGRLYRHIRIGTSGQMCFIPDSYLQTFLPEELKQRMEKIQQTAEGLNGNFPTAVATALLKTTKTIETFFERRLPDNVLGPLAKTLTQQKTNFYIAKEFEGQRLYCKTERKRSTFLAARGPADYDKFIGNIVLFNDVRSFEEKNAVKNTRSKNDEWER